MLASGASRRLGSIEFEFFSQFYAYIHIETPVLSRKNFEPKYGHFLPVNSLGRQAGKVFESFIFLFAIVKDSSQS